ncbi:MAG: patatin family protein [Ruminococcaceae bacterium]|nr:patatin family protein [Oscillospiraceae bacterium]
MLGLIVEGGANRTYYSIGVLDAFIDNNIKTDVLVGVSAGIANATSYVSGQKGRSLEIGMKYIPDKRYMGAKYMFKKGNQSYYNRDFIFDEIPNKLLPFDYDSFNKFEGTAYAVITNIETGEPEYVLLDGNDKKWSVIQASCALPIIFPPIEINGKKYLDGGCADPLPVNFALSKGCDKLIAILTREETYTKETESDVKMSTFVYRKYDKFSKALEKRSKVYNESRNHIYKLRDEGKAFVFSPKNTNGWKRNEKKPHMLKHMYDEGYSDAVELMDKLEEFINK